jgi:hypothetical protein
MSLNDWLSHQKAANNPDHQQSTEERNLERVRQDGWSIQHLVPKERTEAVKLAAMRQIAGLNPNDVLSPQEVFLAAVQRSGKAIEFLSTLERNEAINLAAVQQNDCAIGYLEPEEVASSTELSEWVDANWQSQSLYMAFVSAEEAAAWATKFAQLREQHQTQSSSTAPRQRG